MHVMIRLSDCYRKCWRKDTLCKSGIARTLLVLLNPGHNFEYYESTDAKQYFCDTKQLLKNNPLIQGLKSNSHVP